VGNLKIAFAVVLACLALSVSSAQGKRPLVLDVKKLMSKKELKDTGLKRLSKKQMKRFNEWLTDFAGKARRGEVVTEVANRVGVASLRQMIHFPQKFVGKKVTLLEVSWVAGSVNPQEGNVIRLCTAEGNQTSSIRGFSGELGVVVTDAMAEQIVGANLKVKHFANCNVFGSVSAKGTGFELKATRIEVLNLLGTDVTRVFE
jgi:hypothetical protein